MSGRRTAATLRRTLAACLLLAATGAIAEPLPPAQCRAIPDYGESSILVEWEDVEGETGYRLFRAEAPEGPFEQVGDDLGADVVTFSDPGRVPGVEYYYLVRAFDDAGESPDSNVFQQNISIVWPNPAGESLLHNWNETIGAAAVEGFHKGCDIQQVGPEQNEIVFPRGGVVVRTGNAGKDNNHIYVEVKIGADYRYDSFNHLDGFKASNLGHDVGDYVRAGQAITAIGDRYFTFGSLDYVDHTHFFVPSDPFTNEVDGLHPLSLFEADHQRDPGETRPGAHDHGLLSDGPLLFHRQGAAPGPPYIEQPIGDDPATPGEDEGDVDIHVEIADVMGVGATAVPTSIAYWVEGRACDGRPAVIQGPATPYVLLRWDDKIFRGTGVDWRHIVDEAQDLAPYIRHDGKAYPSTWNNFKHFIVTNTAGLDGDPSHVDESQFWNTNARDDGSPADAAGANFAAAEDATRAVEARFPDGEYTIHVITTDLVGVSDDALEPVRLENFPPAVVEASFRSDSWFRFRFSEPMDTAAVEAALTFGRSGEVPLTYDLAWGPTDSSLDLYPHDSFDPCTQYEVRLDAGLALDTQGNGLDGAFDGPYHDGVARGDPEDSTRSLYSVAGVIEVGELRVDGSVGAPTVLSWPSIPAADGYSVTRSDLHALGEGQYGACFAAGLTDPMLEDPELPVPGSGFGYLVQGENPACAAGSLGADSAGADRLNLDPGACW